MFNRLLDALERPSGGRAIDEPVVSLRRMKMPSRHEIAAPRNMQVRPQDRALEIELLYVRLVGQDHAERAALAHAALDLDLTAVLGDDVRADREPQPRAAWLAG